MDSVYLETTVISYLAARPSRDLLMAAHQQASHDWWRDRRDAFDCYISQVVLDEIRAGNQEAAEGRIALTHGLSVLGATAEAERLTEAILADGAIPVRAVQDAAHISIAAVHGVDSLLTWNCKHPANAQIMRKMSAVCASQGFSMPVICTPEELMGDESVCGTIL